MGIEHEHEHEHDYETWAEEGLAKLQSGDPVWERMVPPEVARIIKNRQFFGYRALAVS